MSLPYQRLYIPYISYIIQRGTPPAEACEKANNQPHIVLFRDEDDESTMSQQYFVCVEWQLMMALSTIVAAIFSVWRRITYSTLPTTERPVMSGCLYKRKSCVCRQRLE